MEKYYEQNIKQDNEERFAKRARILNILRFIALGFGIIFFIIAFYMPSGESTSLGIALLMLLIYLMPCMFFVSLFIVLTKLRNSCVVAFDYILRDKTFMIVKVSNNIKRKKFFCFNVQEMSIIGKPESESHDKNLSSPGIKKIHACVNFESDRIFYSVINNSSGKYILYFEPDDELLRSIRILLGRNIIEKVKD